VEGWGTLAEVGWRWVASITLPEHIDSILPLRKVFSLMVDVLSSGFSMLSDCLALHYGFLFLSEPLYFLLDSNQFLLSYSRFAFPSLLIPVLHMDLIKLGVIMNDLRQRRCPHG
jgi:hypothetical protein